MTLSSTLATSAYRPVVDASAIRYGLLGPLRVFGGAGDTTIGARKIQILLCVLLIRSGQVVSIDQLTAELWGDNAPRRSTAALQVYVSQLRKFLHRPEDAQNPIVTRLPGYVLNTGADQVDVHVFQNLVRQGRQAARDHDHEAAVALFEEGLALWRGPALMGLRDSPAVSVFATWLDEFYLECVEAMVESNLALGRHRDLIGTLQALTAEHPLREAFYRQLMLALYRSERQADALRVYQNARAVLSDELGLEPCRGLRDLQAAILSADDRLDFRPAA
ncbi:AfsR/SARP family transcriptional regulator [Micromonospora sp. NPDC049836]|uniref:AfsR/SARP family transcriptional regulator n=1 Tax=unclassified Micromonospora TaxID=2617518 RepID=UPI0033EBD78E